MIRFRCPVDFVHNLCLPATGKLEGSSKTLWLNFFDTPYLQFGYIANLGVEEVQPKKKFLPHLRSTVGVANGDC